MSHFIADSARIVLLSSGHAGALLVGGDNNVVPRSHNRLFSYLGTCSGVTRALLHADQHEGLIAFPRPLANVRAVRFSDLAPTDRDFILASLAGRAPETAADAIAYSRRHERPDSTASWEHARYLQLVEALALRHIERVPLSADRATRCNDTGVILDLPPLANQYLLCSGRKIVAAVCLSKVGRNGYYALQTEDGEVQHARMTTGRLTKLGYRRSGTPGQYDALGDAIARYAERQRHRTATAATTASV